MENELVTDMDYLIEAIADKCYGKEPLAMALLLYLSEKKIVNYRDVITLFDQRIKSMVENLIKEERQNDK